VQNHIATTDWWFFALRSAACYTDLTIVYVLCFVMLAADKSVIKRIWWWSCFGHSVVLCCLYVQTITDVWKCEKSH